MCLKTVQTFLGCKYLNIVFFPSWCSELTVSWIHAWKTTIWSLLLASKCELSAKPTLVRMSPVPGLERPFIWLLINFFAVCILLALRRCFRHALEAFWLMIDLSLWTQKNRKHVFAWTAYHKTSFVKPLEINFHGSYLHTHGYYFNRFLALLFVTG